MKATSVAHETVECDLVVRVSDNVCVKQIPIFRVVLD